MPKSTGQPRSSGSPTRYLVKQDRHGGIVNDPNAWFDDPRDLISSLRRIVHVSVETVRAIESLPELFGAELDVQSSGN